MLQFAKENPAVVGAVVLGAGAFLFKYGRKVKDIATLAFRAYKPMKEAQAIAYVFEVREGR